MLPVRINFELYLKKNKFCNQHCGKILWPGWISFRSTSQVIDKEPYPVSGVCYSDVQSSWYLRRKFISFHLNALY